MRKLLVMALLVLCMGTLALAQKKQKGGEPSISGLTPREVTDGQVTLIVNSYGNLPDVGGDLLIGPPTMASSSNVFEYINYVSVNNGAVEALGSNLSWSIVNGLAIQGATATSTVKKGQILQVDFSHAVADNGGGLGDWFMSVTFTNLTDQDMSLCYYPYMDYDLFGVATDNSATYAAADPDLGVPTIRVTSAGHPGAVFVVSDYDGLSTDWQIGAHPTVKNILTAGMNCIALGNTGSPFGPGDFTGALKIPLAIAAGDSATVDLQFGRIQ
jgi:hypothetical protein